MTVDRDRVRTLKTVNLATVVDMEAGHLRPRQEWATFDGESLSAEQLDALMSATIDDLEAVEAEHRTDLALQTQALEWGDELRDLVEPYMADHPQRTLAEAVEAMPPPEAARVRELAALAFDPPPDAA